MDVITTLLQMAGEESSVIRKTAIMVEAAMKQSVHDARDGETPVVMHRKNYHEWLVTMRLPDFMELISEKEKEGDPDE